MSHNPGELMFETTSMNLFTDSLMGGVLMFVSFAVVLGGAISAVGWLHSKLSFERLGAWLRVPVGILSVASVIACMMGWMLYGPLKHYGQLEGVVVRGQGDKRTISAQFYSYSKGGRKESLRVFSIQGQELASENRSQQLFKGKPRSLWGSGRAELIQLGDEVALVDVVSRERVVDVGAQLDKRFGQGQYRFKEVQAEQLVIEKLDGKLAYLSINELVPTALLEPMPTQNIWKDCQARARANENEDALYGLLRAHKVQFSNRQFCTYTLGTSAQLILHRASAFGDASDYLLSAVSQDGAKIIWTTDLSPALGQALDDVAIYAPWVKDEQLCFWLVRDKRSLSEVCAEAKTGKLRSSKVIF